MLPNVPSTTSGIILIIVFNSEDNLQIYASRSFYTKFQLKQGLRDTHGR